MDGKQASAQALAEVTEAAEMIRDLEVRQSVALVRLAESYSVEGESLVEALVEKLVYPADGGTPGVSEFLGLELGAALGMTQQSALELVADALNLKYRMPELWRAFCIGLIPRWQATRLTHLTGSLDKDRALWVDQRLAPKVGRVSYQRLRQLLRGLVVQADPVGAADREHRSRQARGVHFGQMCDGTTDMWAGLAPREAKALDRTLSELACAMGEAGDERSYQQRRSAALGVLADPEAALSWLQDTWAAATASGAAGVTDVSGGASPAPGAGCGPRRGGGSRGRSVVYLHLAAETLTDHGTGVVRIEGFGPLTTDSLPEFLAGTSVTIRPVVDDAHVGPVDAYEIPDRIREAVHRRHPSEVFPFSARRSRGLDLDHVNPYQRGSCWQPGQTGTHNLGPVSRLVHRAKTTGVWQMKLTPEGHYEWWSPLGLGYTVTSDGATGPPR